MRRLLLISGEHPPPETIAGFTAARLARHLPAAGWEAEIVRRAGFVRKARSRPAARTPRRASPERPDRFAEWLPFGEAIFDVRQMVREGLARHRADPFAAILASAAPVADCLAGDALARRTGLPVIHMHGDPWGPCRQRAPLRPVWTRIIEGRAERRLNRRAAGLVLNTETARRDYLACFPFLDPDRVHTLRSPCDCTVLSGRTGPTFDSPTLLFPGGFSHFVPPEPIFRLARALKARPELDGVEIALTDDPGPWPAVPHGPHVPLRVIGRHPQAAMRSLMDAADVLIAVSQPSDQRIPLKLSDFLCSERPVLVLEQASNPELRRFVADAGFGTVISAGDPDRAADWVRRKLAGGRHPVAPRNPAFVEELSASRTAQRLARVLDRAMETA